MQRQLRWHGACVDALLVYTTCLALDVAVTVYDVIDGHSIAVYIALAHGKSKKLDVSRYERDFARLHDGSVTRGALLCLGMLRCDLQDMLQGSSCIVHGSLWYRIIPNCMSGL